MPKLADAVAFLEAFAPVRTAAEWDNVGLLLGDAHGDANTILTCLTTTPEVVAEAIAEGVQLIVSHHPVLFRAAKTLSSHTPEGRLLLPLLRAGIAVYSPHTAFDNAAHGINAGLCAKLGIVNAKPLRPRLAKLFKLAVFVPEADLAKVSDALFAAGAGCIGRYEQCSFRTPGTGTFFGTEGTNPAVGQKGRREQVPELRLEVVLPESLLPAVLAALRQAHSYEEPAFDVYPLQSLPLGEGEGRIGMLANPEPLGDFAKRVKLALNANGVQFVGDLARPVQHIAVACGAAGEFLSDATRANADVFMTGEVRFHDALAAQAAGIALVLPGHYATERPAVEDLAAALAEAFPAARVAASRAERDPLQVA